MSELSRLRGSEGYAACDDAMTASTAALRPRTPTRPAAAGTEEQRNERALAFTREREICSLRRRGAGNGIRTRDFHLGKVTLYH